jgi:hypothetical protein
MRDEGKVNMESKWKWFGHAGHLCVGHYCRFHLCTKVGRYLVSTVGDYFPPCQREIDEKRQTIGAGEKSFFETYIFKVRPGKKCTDPQCGCGLPNICLTEVEGYRTATAGQATATHMKMCRKYSA